MTRRLALLGALLAATVSLGAQNPVTVVGGVAPIATSDPTNGLTLCQFTTSASTNAFACGIHNVYAIELDNPTTTISWLRLYNTLSSPTCSSSTGAVTALAASPAGAAGQNGVSGISLTVPWSGFTTGLSGCVTGGSGTTDNTNAIAGIVIKIWMK